MIALTLGTVLALLTLAYVLAPLFTEDAPQRIEKPDPTLPSESASAVATLREIEFDRATGKLSDTDYANLKTSYTGIALAAMRAESANADAVTPTEAAPRPLHPLTSCPSCGPRPEADALYCSSCGRHLGGPCVKCGAAIDQPGARFCARCGHAIAA